MIPILFFYIPGWCSSHNFYVTLVSKKYFMSLDFHPLSLADRSLVWKYTENAGRRNCDLSFANLYAWRMLYRTEVAEWGGFLVFRFTRMDIWLILCLWVREIGVLSAGFERRCVSVVSSSICC